MRRFLNQFIPFFFFGFALVAVFFGVMLLAHLFLLGALLGGILYVGSVLRAKFFPLKPKAPINPRQTKGRIIDSTDWREL